MDKNETEKLVSKLENNQPLNAEEKKAAAFALKQLEQHSEEETGGAETHTESEKWNLIERTKEIRCLHSIMDIIHSSNTDVTQALRTISNTIPEGFVNPEHTHVKIEIDGNTYCSDNYRKSQTNLQTTLIGNKKDLGSLTVTLSSPETSHDDAFLQEEQQLIDSIAKLIATYYDLNSVTEKFKSREELFRTTLYSIGDGVITTDNQGHVLRMNSVAENLTGWKEKHAKGKPLKDIFHIVNVYTRKRVENPVQKVLNTGRVVGLANHTQLISKSGTEIPISDSGAPIKGDDGEIKGVVLVFQDQSKEQENEQAIRQSEEKYRMIYDNSPLGIFQFNEQGYITECNDKHLKFVGSNKDKVIGLNLLENPDKQLVSVAHDVLNGMYRYYEGEYHSVTSDKVTPLRANFAPFVDKSGKVTGGMAIIEDVTERNKAMDAVKRSEERSRSLFENHPDGVGSFDLSGKIVSANEAMTRIFDCAGDELTGLLLEDLISDDDKKEVRENFKKACKGSIQSYQCTGITRKQSHRYISITHIPIIIDDKIEGIYGIIKDITEQRETEELLQKTYSLAQIGRWEKDLISGNDYWSPVTRAIHEVDDEFTPDLQTGLEFYKEGPNRDKVSRAVQDAIEKGDPFDIEAQIVTAQDNERWIRIIGEAEFRGGTCTRIYGSIQNIDKRKKAEIESEKNRLILETITDKAEAPIFVKDYEGRYLLANEQFKRYFVASDEDIIGKTEFDILNEPTAWYFRENDYEVLESNKPTIKEERIRTERGYRYFLSNIFPMTGIAGLKGAIGGFATDITEIKEAERRAQSQREAISYLATDKKLAGKTLQERLQVIAKTSAHTLNIDNVHIWIFNDGNLKCLASYDNGVFDKLAGATIQISDYPTYYKELQNNRVIVCENVDTDTRLDDLRKDFLSDHDIKAFIDSNIFSAGQIVGLVGHNVKGEARKWSQDEITFAESVSDQVAHVLADEERKNNEHQILESLKEKETLLAEIHHRVKNNLAVVSSMMQLQAYKAENKDLSARLLDSVGRIKAMATIHEHLYRSESFTDLDFSDNIEKLISSIVDATPSETDVQLSFECQSIDLNVVQAVPCSLIVNEVVTNILKHAFKNREKGNIVTSLLREGNKVTLSIRDDGIGLPDDFQKGKSNTLGLQIIKVLTDQLEGRHWYESLDAGSCFILEFEKSSAKD